MLEEAACHHPCNDCASQMSIFQSRAFPHSAANVVALQVAILEQLADLHAPAAGDSRSEQQSQVVAAGGSGVRAVALSAVLPVLGERQVDQMLQRLHQVTEVRLQSSLYGSDIAFYCVSGTACRTLCLWHA
jgi:hypothetical protein